MLMRRTTCCGHQACQADGQDNRRAAQSHIRFLFVVSWSSVTPGVSGRSGKASTAVVVLAGQPVVETDAPAQGAPVAAKQPRS